MGQIDDLNEAIELSRRAIQTAPHDHLDLPNFLNALESRLGTRFDRTGQMKDLEEAIQMSRRLVEMVQMSFENHPSLPGWLSNLGILLERR